MKEVVNVWTTKESEVLFPIPLTREKKKQIMHRKEPSLVEACCAEFGEHDG